ncbi:MAG: metallophosphoesterase [Thermoguttaceae bacterium]
MFKQGTGDWTKYRELKPVEIDFHNSQREQEEEGYVPHWEKRRRRKHEEPPPVPYYMMMEEVWADALDALKYAQESARTYVLFLARLIHVWAGWRYREVPSSFADAEPGSCSLHHSQRMYRARLGFPGSYPLTARGLRVGRRTPARARARG